MKEVAGFEEILDIVDQLVVTELIQSGSPASAGLGFYTSPLSANPSVDRKSCFRMVKA